MTKNLAGYLEVRLLEASGGFVAAVLIEIWSETGTTRFWFQK